MRRVQRPQGEQRFWRRVQILRAMLVRSAFNGPAGGLERNTAGMDVTLLSRPAEPRLVAVATAIGLVLMTVTVAAQEAERPGGENPATATVQRWEAEFNELAGQLGDPDYPRYREGEKAPPVLNPHSLLWEDDRDPLDVVLRRTAALLADLEGLSGERMAGYSRELAGLRRSSNQIPPAGEGTAAFSARRKLFLAACGLRRRLALSNPLLDFERIIYVRGEGYSGLFQTAPWEKFTHPNRAWTKEEWATFNFHDPQGEEEPDDTERFPGLFVCSRFKSETPRVKPLFTESRLWNGRHKGKILAAFPGTYQYGFDLSYDGKTVLFAKQLGTTGPYHIFKATLDPSASGDPGGGEIVQLTDGWFADWEPCFLPNGRIGEEVAATSDRPRRASAGALGGWSSR